MQESSPSILSADTPLPAGIEVRPHVETIIDVFTQPEYRESSLQKKFSLQSNFTPLAAFTDIDGTYLIPGKPTESKYRAATNAVTIFLTEKNIPIIAVTGRDLPSVTIGQPGGLEYENEQLPKFDVVLCAVGTEIYILQKDGTYLKDESYGRYLRETIGFNRDSLYAIAQELVISYNAKDNSNRLVFQPRDSESNVSAYLKDPNAKNHGLTKENPPQEYKISLNFDGTQETANNMHQLFRTKFDQLGYEKVKIVISFDKYLTPDHTLMRFNIDIIPVTKRDAIAYLIERSNCLGVVAGDSGNDSEMLFQIAQAGVVVGGMKPELEATLNKVSSKPENVVKKTRHFSKLRLPNNTERLLWIQPADEDKKGPESLLTAAKMFTKLIALRNTML